MKNAVQKSMKGWAVKLGIAATGAACLILSSTTASAGSVTQLKYLQTLVQLTGDSGQFNADSKPADYIQWAKNRNMNLNWNAKGKLSSDVMAQSLVHLFGLNPRKYGGDYVRILAREGIDVPAGDISSESLASLVDNPNVAVKLAQASTSPVKPGNGNGNGYGWYEHQAGIPKPPPPRGLGLGRGNLPKPR
jgi:hypothetical protein